MNDFYYLCELIDNDAINRSLILKFENLEDFMKNLDTENYTLNNMYGLGKVSIDYKEFIKKDNS